MCVCVCVKSKPDNKVFSLVRPKADGSSNTGPQVVKRLSGRNDYKLFPFDFFSSIP